MRALASSDTLPTTAHRAAAPWRRAVRPGGPSLAEQSEGWGESAHTPQPTTAPRPPIRTLAVPPPATSQPQGPRVTARPC
jgi:hypothetical protein